MHSQFSPIENLLSSKFHITDSNGDLHYISPEAVCGLTVELALHPAIESGRWLFDMGHSDWMFKLHIIHRSSDHSKVIASVYKDPHDLWRLLRSRPFYEADYFHHFYTEKERAFLSPQLLYCSTDDREGFEIKLIRASGETLIRGFWKYGGFSCALCAGSKWLWLDCFSGGFSRITEVEGQPFSHFDSSYCFPFTLDEWLELPSYSYKSDSDECHEWIESSKPIRQTNPKFITKTT